MSEISFPSASKVWKPNAGPQTEFVSLPDSIFEAFYGGAAGGGKSDALLMLPFVRGFYKISSFKAIIFRRTYKMLEESLIPRTKVGIGFRDGQPGPSYYDFGGTYNDQKHTWTFPSGATIRLSYLDKDDDAYDHKSSEYHYIAFDELTTFTKFMYIYLTSRCRSVDPRLPAIVRSASNPGDIGNYWVRERFVEADRKGRKILILKNLTGSTTKAIFIPAKLADNPCLNEADPAYTTRLDMLPEAERKALKDGDFWVFSGQYFKEFRSIWIPGEPQNALHVITPFEIPYYWPKILSVDWGYDHENSVHCSAVAPDGRIFVFYEDVRRKELISEWAPDIALDLGHLRENLVAKVIDPSSNRHDGHEETIKQQIEKYSGFTFEDAENSRISGWNLLRDFMRWKPKPPRRIPPEGFNPAVADRIRRLSGEARYLEYLDLFTPEAPETNLPRFQIFSTCPELIKRIPLAVHDEKNTEDVLKFDGDDPLDDIRYGMKAVHRYLEKSRNAFREVQAKQDIIDRFHETGNMTGYYQAMNKFENDHKVVPLNLLKMRKKFGYGRRYSAYR